MGAALGRSTPRGPCMSLERRGTKSPRATSANSRPPDNQQPQPKSTLLAAEVHVLSAPNGRQSDHFLPDTQGSGNKGKPSPPRNPIGIETGGVKALRPLSVSNSSNSVSADKSNDASSSRTPGQKREKKNILRSLDGSVSPQKQGPSRESNPEDIAATPPLLRMASLYEGKGSSRGRKTGDESQEFGLSGRVGGNSVVSRLHFLSAKKSQESIFSDAQSNGESAINLAQTNNTRSRQSMLGSIESTKTLLHAKAVLRKHVHHSLAIPPLSARPSSCRSTTYSALSEGDAILTRTVNPLIPRDKYGGNFHLPAVHNVEAVDGIGKIGRYHDRIDIISLLENNTQAELSSSSSCLVKSPLLRENGDSWRQQNGFLADKCPNHNLVELVVDSATDEKLNGQSGDRSSRDHLLRSAPPTDCYPLADVASRNPTPRIDCGHSSQNEFGCTKRPGKKGDSGRGGGQTGQDAADDAAVGWVAIGGEAGVGGEDWYARLRARCGLEESGGIAGLTAGNIGDCSDDDVKKNETVAPVGTAEPGTAH
ncbi:hypothetical protein, conserved [Trypanosoma cruzi]|uniref:Uncharacterized protein n=1 Tax=Trypanosoma cruzi (strain CL Brener) TaxID=353153 RepID=Q4D2X0_TRYCC|nr:hypothetical protein, conserved [Trypanosoma cruzi]EAN86874.1 hypothetical protein, conserved [Trypanosoma cruzi]|eukprot:XP_808725.1 hypothetical protein [Trypanosoma cruzi strain CL Brener]